MSGLESSDTTVTSSTEVQLLQLLAAWRKPSSALVRFMRNRMAVGGTALLLMITVTSMLSPYLIRHVLQRDPNRIDFAVMAAPPSDQYLLGTDQIGRDVLLRTLDGGRGSIIVGVSIMLVSSLIGVSIGAVTGYTGGLIDALLMRFTESMMAIPGFYLLLLIATVFRPPGLLGPVLVLSVTSWMGMARVIRAEFLAAKERDYVMAARAMGASNLRIIARHIFPNVVPIWIVAATLSIAAAILAESSLSFLNLGVLPPQATWGNMIAGAMTHMKRPWIYFPPSIMIFLTIICINFLGDGLRDALDPRAERARA
jgi:peptide/nickel transport system permease protein